MWASPELVRFGVWLHFRPRVESHKPATTQLSLTYRKGPSVWFCHVTVAVLTAESLFTRLLVFTTLHLRHQPVQSGSDTTQSGHGPSR